MSPATRDALVYHVAPVLLNKKPAALFTHPAQKGDLTSLAEKLQTQGLAQMEMRQHKNRVLLLVYHPQLLAASLAQPQTKRLLEERGYPHAASLVQMLVFLINRLQLCEDFPHEIGLFLGYPPEDVDGFIHNNGCNYKLSGKWKVYGSVAQATRLFNEYDRCSDRLRRHFEAGGSLHTLTDITGQSAVCNPIHYLEVANG